jgi:hypothetical protein
MAQRLTDETGMRWIDAPVSGGAAAALPGSMTVMAGGAVEDFEAARPLWDALSGQCTLMGPTGAGQSTKMINQVLVLGGFAPVAEAAALAINAGIDAARIPGALSGGRADSRLLQESFARMINPGGEALGKNSVNVKDLALAGATGPSMPLLTVVRALNHKLIRMGLADECSTTVIRALTKKWRCDPTLNKVDRGRSTDLDHQFVSLGDFGVEPLHQGGPDRQDRELIEIAFVGDFTLIDHRRAGHQHGAADAGAAGRVGGVMTVQAGDQGRADTGVGQHLFHRRIDRQTQA